MKRRNVYLNRYRRKMQRKRRKALKENLWGMIGTVIFILMFYLPFVAKMLEW